MAGDLKGLFRGQVRTLFDAGTVTGLTDGQLLERFATRRGSRGRDRLRDRLTRRGLASGVLAWPVPREPLPAELVGATVAAAARFVSTQAASQGTAALLALGVLRTMAMTSWWKVASVLLVMTASTSGVVSLAGRGVAVEEAKPDDPPQAARADVGPTAEVKSGKLSVVVDEWGTLEASRRNDVACQVEGQSAILSILPEGTRVKKGQLVCELDSASLRDQVINQRIAMAVADDAYEKAKLAREVAEIALKEYVEGVYPREHASAVGGVRLAESAVKSAEARLQRTRSARERLNTILSGQKGSTPADVAAELDVDDRLAAAELAVPRERLALEIGQDKLGVLEKFTKDRTVKELNIEIQTARAAEVAKQNARDLEKSKAKNLELQIVNCKLYAPSDGMVVYSNDPHYGASRIEEGATVRERQWIFNVPDLTSIRVAAWVREAIVHQVAPGQTVRIKVDAFPDETFNGVVESVTPHPDPSSFFNVCSTNIAITKGAPGLRPGMTADVEILVAALDDVLSVPVQAVVEYDDKRHVAVKKPAGGVEWREVKLGLSNDKKVEVKEGLKAGETIALEPIPLLSEEQKGKQTPQPAGDGR
ncbi:MAG: efflux RND transporter periplasmic adaptor subunit [Paludisphaera borealis]|uniref:efflux RND transporter periplasmic adaptor subunit n=1 Tax=Paludisphaera borealis TaxID=1387353 RepID=UPI0028403319|nr:efflux RND transporter periplasmic adaptor subunit [Paludisphaera borealis]MDR3623323.1 efflux RND transporter periplasmic adaptor subunit [Paludisphaera borealis]